MMPFNNCDSTLEVDSGDVVRILIATDIHLGTLKLRE